MTDKERLYEIFGELLYAIAMADGLIQPEEVKALEKILDGHHWAKSIKWSFNYEVGKETNIEDVYNKVIDFCHRYGPAPEYADFISAMQAVSEAADGVVESEAKIINSFSKDLTARFQQDLDKK